MKHSDDNVYYEVNPAVVFDDICALMNDVAFHQLILSHGILNSDSRFGWITDDGVFLGCNYASHSLLSKCLGIEDTKTLEFAGWIHVTVCHFHGGGIALRHIHDPTNSQRATADRLFPNHHMDHIHVPNIGRMRLPFRISKWSGFSEDLAKSASSLIKKTYPWIKGDINEQIS